MQTTLLLRHTETALTVPAHALEKRGAVYTKPWIVELLLDMAGYDVAADLAAKFTVEPAAGEGAFLVPMALRLLRSARLKGRGPLECKDSLLAYELDRESAAVARGAITQALVRERVTEAEARTLASGWVRVGDYLTEAASQRALISSSATRPTSGSKKCRRSRRVLSRDLPDDERAGRPVHRLLRAALRQLADGGCALHLRRPLDAHHYGGELRRLVTSEYAVEASSRCTRRTPSSLR